MAPLRPQIPPGVDGPVAKTFDRTLLAGYLLNAPKAPDRRANRTLENHHAISAQRRPSFCAEPAR